ncbi:hypothetical protein C1N83_08960 [Priestia aryabhattai]|nr:hypothetical protein C2I28_05200 [Priestia megaterium]
MSQAVQPMYTICSSLDSFSQVSASWETKFSTHIFRQIVQTRAENKQYKCKQKVSKPYLKVIYCE